MEYFIISKLLLTYNFVKISQALGYIIKINLKLIGHLGFVFEILSINYSINLYCHFLKEYSNF